MRKLPNLGDVQFATDEHGVSDVRYAIGELVIDKYFPIHAIAEDVFRCYVKDDGGRDASFTVALHQTLDSKMESNLFRFIDQAIRDSDDFHYSSTSKASGGYVASVHYGDLLEAQVSSYSRAVALLAATSALLLKMRLEHSAPTMQVAA